MSAPTSPNRMLAPAQPAPDAGRQVSLRGSGVSGMRPRWKTTIGVLGIIFGCFGALSASQVALMPTMLEWQRTFWTTMSTVLLLVVLAHRNEWSHGVIQEPPVVSEA